MKCTVETCALKLPPTNTFLCEMLLVNYGFFFYMLDLLKYVTHACESIKSNIKGRVAPCDHWHCVHVHTRKHTHSVTLPEYPYVINWWPNWKLWQVVWPLVKKLHSATSNKHNQRPARDGIRQTIATLSLDRDSACQAFEPLGAKQKDFFTKPGPCPQKASLLWQLAACVHLFPWLVGREADSPYHWKN